MLWQHLETANRLLSEGAEEPVPVATMMGKVIARYRKEYLPNLAKSTRNTDGSMLKVHIEPQWGSVGIADVRPMAVDEWLKSLTLSSASKGRARTLLKQLIDKTMFWEMIPSGKNLMTLVKVKGVSKRQKKIVLLRLRHENAVDQAGIFDQYGWTVEAHRLIVEDRAYERRKIFHLEVGGGVCGECEAGGMRFWKTV